MIFIKFGGENEKVLLTLIVIAIASALMAMPLPGKEEALKIFKQINSFKINAENTRLQNPMCIYEDNMDNNEWAYVGKYVYEYENNQVANVVYNRLGQIEEETVLIPFMRYHYTYSNGKISIISMEMNANMMDPEGEPLWIALMSMYYQYNNQNHLTMMYMAATDMETGEMIIGSRVHFVYENNRVHSVVNFEIDEETEEVMYDKSVVEYDANGRAIQMIAYSSPDSSSWTQYEKTVMTYDPTDTSNYDTFQNIVDNSNYMQIGFNYNFGTARVNNEMTYSWNGSEWENLGKELYAYDTNWNITLNQEQEWINNDWQTFSEVQLAYVNAQQLDYQIHKELNNDILQEYIRYRYNYTTANDNQVIAPSTISISAYPNPFNGNTNITVKSNDKQVKVQLYNIKGRLIAEENMNLNRSNNVNFNTEHLSSGIYFVKVKSATESKTCKIMKIK